MREAIVAHARDGAPQEVCGLVAGRGGRPERVIRCTNIHATPATRYEIDPRDQLTAFREMDDRGEDLVAIYHSHPATQPYPSPTDRAEAHYPDVLYVLVSLRAEPPEVRGYRILPDGGVREVDLITEAPRP